MRHGPLICACVICARATGSTNITILSGATIPPCYVRSCWREHQFHRSTCARASGSTNFINQDHQLAMLYMRPCWREHQFQRSIRDRPGGSTNFTTPSGAPVSPCYMRPCWWEHPFHRCLARTLAGALIFYVHVLTGAPIVLHMRLCQREH